MEKKSNIVRIKTKPKPEVDKRGGGSAKKMFFGVRDRIQLFSAEYDFALSDYPKVYSQELSNMPYLIFELEPSAIAKSHSPREFLKKQNLDIIAGRNLRERIVHGKQQSFKKFSDVLHKSIEIAPADKQLREWNESEKNAKEKAKQESKTSGKTVKTETVRRSLGYGDITWNEMAQLSVLSNIKILKPEDKLTLFSADTNKKDYSALINTFPFCDALGDDLTDWIQKIEFFAAKNSVFSIEVLRTDKQKIDVIKKLCGKNKNLWNLDLFKSSYANLISSIIMLVKGKSKDNLYEFSKLPFIYSIEPCLYELSSIKKSNQYFLSTLKKNPDKLSTVGIIDTGISKPSVLDDYIIARRGIEALRKKNNPHALDVAYLLAADKSVFPWSKDEISPACSIIDVAAINGGNEDLIMNITQGTKNHDDTGVVNISANIKRSKQSSPPASMSALGSLFDEHCLKNEELAIVNSAGNSGSVGMDSPADGSHVISVGAITKSPDGLFYPSEYSCCGGGLSHNVKPTFVIPIDDQRWSNPDWSTQVPNNNQGTSYAAPVVSRIFANLMQEKYTRDEALTLMVHNAAHPGQNIFYQPNTEDFEKFGFGIAPSLSQCDPKDSMRFTLLFDAKVRKGTIQILKLPIPEELNPYSSFVRLTSYTRSPVNLNFGEEYIAAEVPTRLRLYRTKGKATHVDLPAEPSDYKSRYEEHRIKYGWKWNVLRRYSMNIKFDSFNEFELRLGPVTWRDWVNFSVLDSEEVKVQCVLTFYPVEPDAPGFFDHFYSSFINHKIEMEIPAQMEIEQEISV